MTEKTLKIIPFGGLGEIGKNMTLYEYDGEAIIVDCGIMFPEGDMPGIDYIIPDFNYMHDQATKVKAIFFTHGHEDHIGAVNHALEVFDVPIYATPFTRALLEVKLKRGKRLEETDVRTMIPREAIQVGPFTVEPFHVCHSIPDAVGLGITTPVGLAVHSGDFKFDHTPVDGRPTDIAKLAEFGERGVLVLLSDSTNADQPGWTKSEAAVNDALRKIFTEAPGRIIVATFASLISRVFQVAQIAREYGRKVATAGYTMVEYSKIAGELGLLDMPDDLFISLDQVGHLPPEQVVVMATGTQGERNAVMGRLAGGRHNDLDIQYGDTVIMSAHSIPGNEEMIFRTINRLFQRGANVIYDPIAPVHVSGHAKQEEHKLLIRLVKPKFFVPVHGELRHLYQHAFIAQALGIPAQNMAVVENGTTLTFTPESMDVGERVPGGYVFVDGSVVGDIGPAVIRDREALSRDGFLLALVNVDRQTGSLTKPPEVISRGFVFMREAEDLMDDIRAEVRQAIQNGCDRTEQESCIQSAVSRLVYKATRRRPMVFAVVNEV